VAMTGRKTEPTVERASNKDIKLITHCSLELYVPLYLHKDIVSSNDKSSSKAVLKLS